MPWKVSWAPIRQHLADVHYHTIAQNFEGLLQSKISTDPRQNLPTERARLISTDSKNTSLGETDGTDNGCLHVITWISNRGVPLHKFNGWTS